MHSYDNTTMQVAKISYYRNLIKCVGFDLLYSYLAKKSLEAFYFLFLAHSHRISCTSSSIVILKRMIAAIK